MVQYHHRWRLPQLLGAALVSAMALSAAPAVSAQGVPSVQGRVFDVESGRSIPGVVLELSPSRQRSISDSSGFFRFGAVPAGRAVVRARHAEYAPRDTTLVLPLSGGVFAIGLRPRSLLLAPLTVRADQSGPEAERALFDREPTPGVVGISRQEMRDIPALAEPDVLRSLQAVPGVVLLNDFSAHLNVRGGGPDQNLFLLDDARVFAPYHVFGMFGAFNPDAIARAEFYRGSLPARFGGALSSVVDLEQRDGSKDGPTFDGGVSLLGARAAASGETGAARWMFAARRSDADVVMPRITGKEFPYAFHDAQGRVSVIPARDHRVQASFFVSSDRYVMTGHGAEEDLHSRWRNGVGSLRWTWVGPRRWSVSATTWASTYTGELISGAGQVAPATENRVRVGGVRVEAIGRGESRGLRAGLEVEAGRVALEGDEEPGSYIAGRTETAYAVPAAYAEAEQWVGRFRLTPGLRVASYGRGNGVFLEPRVSGRLHLSEDLALTVGVGRSHQVLSSLRDDRQVMPGAPFWFVHPEGAPPSRTDGASVALEGWRGGDWSFALEGYVRAFRDVPRWRPAGSRELDQVAFDDGTAAGAEVTLRRHAGRLTGWIGIGWSRVELQEAGTGRKYAPAWDRRHAVDAALFYRPWSRLTLSTRTMYGSGLPFWPFAGYVTAPRLEPFAGATREKGSIPVWADRQERFPAYARVDLSARFRFRVRGTELEPFVNVQNVTARQNVLYYRLVSPPRNSDIPPMLEPRTAFSSSILPSIGIDVRF